MNSFLYLTIPQERSGSGDRWGWGKVRKGEGRNSVILLGIKESNETLRDKKRSQRGSENFIKVNKHRMVKKVMSSRKEGKGHQGVR